MEIEGGVSGGSVRARIMVSGDLRRYSEPRALHFCSLAPANEHRSVRYLRRLGPAVMAGQGPVSRAGGDGDRRGDGSHSAAVELLRGEPARITLAPWNRRRDWKPGGVPGMRTREPPGEARPGGADRLRV